MAPSAMAALYVGIMGMPAPTNSTRQQPRSAALFHEDRTRDRQTLAMLSLPVLALALALGLTQTMKVGRHAPISAAPVSVTAARLPVIPQIAARPPANLTPHTTVALVSPTPLAAIHARGVERESEALSPRAIALTQPEVMSPRSSRSVAVSDENITTPDVAARPVGAAVSASMVPVITHVLEATAARPASMAPTPLAATSAPAPTAHTPPAAVVASDLAPLENQANQHVAMLAPSAIHPDATTVLAPPSQSSRETDQLPVDVCTAPPHILEGLAKPYPPRPAGVLTGAAFGMALAAAAQAQIGDLVIYNDRYRQIAYPMGDVAPLYGVCTDVVIRAYRGLGIDLQQLVHDSGLGGADTSIGHRRTETLRRYFTRYGAALPVSTIAEDYRPGDIVTYNRPQNRRSKSHIALVSGERARSGRYKIIHNRGWGPQLEDGLFVDEITGHYRYEGPADQSVTAGAKTLDRASPLSTVDSASNGGLVCGVGTQTLEHRRACRRLAASKAATDEPVSGLGR